MEGMTVPARLLFALLLAFAAVARGGVLLGPERPLPPPFLGATGGSAFVAASDGKDFLVFWSR